MKKPKLYIIVQAGGRGSRLRHHTWNKPKCLVSVNGKPLLYHCFETFKDAHFIVIGDYMFDQLAKYLSVNPPGVDYELVQTNEKGTASGIASALEMVPEDAPLLITWSDLLLESRPVLPMADVPVVFTTSAFTCRWTVSSEGILQEAPASTGGVPGLFYFSKAALMPAPPASGEFVKWFSMNVARFTTVAFDEMSELGDFSSIEQSNDRAGFSRFFNKVEVKESQVVKTVIDSAYDEVHRKEVAWYEAAQTLRFPRIPKIYNLSPLTMERIHGDHAYQLNDLTDREQRAVMADYLDSLMSLHASGQSETVQDDIRDVYLTKTMSRVESVIGIIPNIERESITVNGRKCRNVFSPKHAGTIDGLLPHLLPAHFTPIHGDPTFSNSLIDDKLRAWFIDPRGYFLRPGIMGDPWYDFAKVYYSAVGGYDTFNRRKFKLHIDSETVEVLIEEPYLSRTSKVIFAEYFGPEMARLKILHGLIWLALSGYAKDDIDSIIGSFYLGLYWLEDGMSSL